MVDVLWCTAFVNKGEKTEILGELLMKENYHKSGKKPIMV